METKLVIFDMDGVLIDSERIYSIEIGKIRDKWGVVIPKEYEGKFMGTTRAAGKKMYKELFGNKFDYDAYQKDIDQHVEEWFKHNTMEVKKGIFELIHYCEEHNIKLAVGTSSSGFRVDNSLKPNGLYDHFDLIMTGDKVTNSKPDPEIYNKVIEHFGFDKKEVIVIEDSNYGVLAAVRSGAISVHIPDVARVEEDTLKQVQYILPDASKVIDLIEGRI